MKSVLTPVDYQVINNLIQQKQQVGLSQFTRIIQSLDHDFMCEWNGNTFFIYKSGNRENGIQFVIDDAGNIIRNVKIGEVEDLTKRVGSIETEIDKTNENLTDLENEFNEHNHDNDYAEKDHTHTTINNDLTVTGAIHAKYNIRFGENPNNGARGVIGYAARWSDGTPVPDPYIQIGQYLNDMRLHIHDSGNVVVAKDLTVNGNLKTKGSIQLNGTQSANAGPNIYMGSVELRTAENVLNTWINGAMKQTINADGVKVTGNLTVTDSLTVNGIEINPSNYAESNHDHDERYSQLSHTHSEYLTELPNHDHDERYSQLGHTHSEYLTELPFHTHNYADNEHDHDERYSQLGHTHSEYLTELPDHEHIEYVPLTEIYDIIEEENGQLNLIPKYANVNHNHDRDYADINHTHDYAASNHNHDERYLHVNQSLLFAWSDHNHDNTYVAKDTFNDAQKDMKKLKDDLDDLEDKLKTSNIVHGIIGGVNGLANIFEAIAILANDAKSTANTVQTTMNTIGDTAQSAYDMSQSTQTAQQNLQNQQDTLNQRLNEYSDSFSEFSDNVQEVRNEYQRIDDTLENVQTTQTSISNTVQEVRNGYQRLDNSVATVQNTANSCFAKINSEKWITMGMLGGDILMSLGNTFANQTHTHNEYAPIDGLYETVEQDGEIFYVPLFAEAEHEHPEYLPIEEFYDKIEIEGEEMYIDKYAEVDHDHDERYAEIGHEHPEIIELIDELHREGPGFQEVKASQTWVTENFAEKEHTHDDTYSDINHNHNDTYAEKDHDHDERYAEVSHQHEDYAEKAITSELAERISTLELNGGGSNEQISTIFSLVETLMALHFYTKEESDKKYSEIEHNHDGRYAEVGHTHEEFNNINHNHDDKYSDINHNHDDKYAEKGHNHDGYAEAGHNHDAKYSDINHNHDERYSLASHNHDERYSGVSHNHDDKYAEVSHTHSTIDNALTVDGTLTAKSSIHAKSNIRFGENLDNGVRGVIGYTTHWSDGTPVPDPYIQIGQYLNDMRLHIHDSGNVVVAKDLTVNGNLTVKDSLTANPSQTTITSQAVSITGETSIANHLDVGGSLDVSGNIINNKFKIATTDSYVDLQYNDEAFLYYDSVGETTYIPGNLDISGNIILNGQPFGSGTSQRPNRMTIGSFPIESKPGAYAYPIEGPFETGGTDLYLHGRIRPGKLLLDAAYGQWDYGEIEWINSSLSDGKNVTLRSYGDGVLRCEVTNIMGETLMQGPIFGNSQTVTHVTDVNAELGTFCESTGKVYSGYEKIEHTDCICGVQQAHSLNKKIVGIISSKNQFASHGDVLVRVADGQYEVGDILCPDENGYGKVATDNDLMFMMMHAIPRPKITSLETGMDGYVACFLV